LYRSRHIDNDLWMNWEKFIFYNDPFKEEFVLGNRADFKFRLGDMHFDIPFHYTWTHAGGQIDRHDENRGSMMSLNNIMTGMKVRYEFDSGLLKSVSAGYSYYIYKAGANPPPGDKRHQLFDSGYGHYIKSNLDFGSIKLMLGYWRADSFIALKGEYIFSSVFEHRPGEYMKEKELFTSKLIYDYKIKENIIFSVRSDLYYQPVDKNLFYSYAFYFIYNDAFLLHNAAKKSLKPL